MDVDLIVLELAIKDVAIFFEKLSDLSLLGSLCLIQLLNHHHPDRNVPRKALQNIQLVTLHIQHKEINQWNIRLL